MTKAKTAARSLSLVASVPAPALTAPKADAKAAPKAAPTIRFTGKQAAARQEAFDSIAPLSFAETSNRMLTVENLKVALGAKPTPDQIKAASNEWVIGRVAARLGAFDMSKSREEHIAHARNVVLHFAMPSTGAKPARLKAGQLGRRTDAEHKAVRAANEAWSQILAETGHGNAQTQSQRDAAKLAKKRATRATPVRAMDKVDAKAAPSHSALVQEPAPVDADTACNFLATQAATLQAYANKYAALLPADFGTAVAAFQRAIIRAGEARALAKAKVQAEKAEASK